MGTHRTPAGLEPGAGCGVLEAGRPDHVVAGGGQGQGDGPGDLAGHAGDDERRPCGSRDDAWWSAEAVGRRRTQES